MHRTLVAPIISADVLPLCAVTHIAAKIGRRSCPPSGVQATAARHPATRNRILAALPAADYRRLQETGLIRHRRGRITVLDRPKLERRVCECYGVVKRETDRLLAYGGGA